MPIDAVNRESYIDGYAERHLGRVDAITSTQEIANNSTRWRI